MKQIMKLEFGNPDHIAEAKKGAVPEGVTATIEIKDGCADGCCHCNYIHYKCSNCGKVDDDRGELVKIFEDNEHCRYCNARIAA